MCIRDRHGGSQAGRVCDDQELPRARYGQGAYRGEERWVMVRATSKFTRVSPRKARMAIDMLWGKAVDEAVAILRLSPRGAAPIVRKVLGSSVANTENNHEMVAYVLYVAEAYVDQGPT